MAADDPHPEIPQELALSVYPNPFNSSTTISLSIPLGVKRVQLKTINILGQVVQSTEQKVNAGHSTVHYDGSDLPTGIYFLQAQAKAFRSVTKLVVLK